MNYLQIIKQSIKGKSFQQQTDIIKEFIIFDNPKNYTSGVYLIENFYVGMSGNFVNRIASHIIEVLSIEESNIVYNKEKLYLISNVLKNRKLKVKILHKDQKKEEQYISWLYFENPLVNIEFITPEMIARKQKQITSKLKGIKLDIKISQFTSKFYIASTIINKTVIFKIARTSKDAKLKLEKYLTIKPPKKQKKLREKSTSKKSSDKNIESFKFVGIRSKTTKAIYHQHERWKEAEKNNKGCSVRGFDDIHEARCWVLGKQIPKFPGE